MPWDDPEVAGYVSVPGGRLWYRANGLSNRERTPLIAINGGPGMSHHYMVPLLALTDDRPVVLYDQLDTGNADRPGSAENRNIIRFVTEVSALRDALDLNEVIILGHSWGSIVGIEYAHGKPDGLKALILASPAISIRRWIADTAALVSELPADLQQIIADCEARSDFNNPDFDRAIREFGLKHVCRTNPRPDYVLKSFSTFGSPVYNALWGPSEFSARGLLKSYEGGDRLSQISVPTLFTCGEFDMATPDACRDFAAMMANASLTVFDDASHFTFDEKPEAYVATIRDFLADIG
jgi:proline iminopeptidase